jgi:prophage regulatory protein
MQSIKRVLGFKQLKPEKGIPWTRQYINRLEKQGRFPKKARLGPNTIGWVEDELDALIAERLAERDREPQT